MSGENTITDITNIIKADPAESVHVDYSFGRKSGLLAYCAIHAGKIVTLRIVRAKDRIFPDVLEEMDVILSNWKTIGAIIEIKDITCHLNTYRPENVKKGMPPFDCIRALLKYRKTNRDKTYLSSITRGWGRELGTDKIITPFMDITEQDVYKLNDELPPELYLDLAKFDCPHYCANPICPHWKVTRPDSLERYKRWTNAKTR